MVGNLDPVNVRLISENAGHFSMFIEGNKQKKLLVYM